MKIQISSSTLGQMQKLQAQEDITKFGSLTEWALERYGVNVDGIYTTGYFIEGDQEKVIKLLLSL